MKNFLIIATLSVCSSLYSMEEQTITLASAEILGQRLAKEGFDHFIEKTQIDKKLGNRQVYPVGVATAVECALYDYNEYMKQPMIAALMQMRKPELIETLLQDHPEAIENLKEHGILKP